MYAYLRSRPPRRPGGAEPGGPARRARGEGLYYNRWMLYDDIIYVYIYIIQIVYIHIYIYTHRERERERDVEIVTERNPLLVYYNK